MAVVSVKILHDGWNASFSNESNPTFKVVYLVEVDDPQDGNMLVVDAEGIPKFGDAYRVGQDFAADVRLKSLTTSPVAGTRNLWQVSASYGVNEAKKPEKQGDVSWGKTQEGEDTEDVLKFAVTMSTSTTRVSTDATNGTYLGQYQDGQFFKDRGFVDYLQPPEPHPFVESDRDGKITNARSITNSVFRPFDPPPQVEYNRTNVKIKWNTLNMPKKILKYVNSVNRSWIRLQVSYKWDDEFGEGRASWAHVEIPSFAGRIMGLTSSPNEGNGQGYHDNELEIEVDSLFTWRMDVLDRGYAVMNYDKTFPSPGDPTNGIPVTDGDVGDDGFENREPVLLDGKGKKLNVINSEGVFLRYGVYPEMEWRDISLDQLQLIGQLDD
jgi:hypothetical protein